MKWQGRQRSSNIEDRRGAGGGGFGRTGGFSPFGTGGGIRLPGGRAGGGGIGGILIIIVIFVVMWLMTGQNPLDMLTGSSSNIAPSTQSRPLPDAGEDQLADFVGVVVKETETLWTDVFRQNNMTYTPPTVVLFSGATQSACGTAQSATGPFYCPLDQKVYIDLAFYDQLRSQFGAPGDFAQAYVIAHEVGHHVQQLTGVLPDFNAQRGAMSQDEQNAYSVKVELQADCYAGVWANYVGQEGLLDSGDFREAMVAANAIGDDTLTRGQVSPRNFTHGTSEQRMRWFERGYDSGDVGQCDTFAAASL